MSRNEIFVVSNSDMFCLGVRFWCLGVRYLVSRSEQFGVSEFDFDCLGARYLMSRSKILAIWQ